MPLDGLSDYFAQPHRNGVSDHTPDGLKAAFLTGLHKGVILREGLEDGSFAQRDGAVLLRVTKASVAEAVKLGGHGGSRLVPRHAFIDSGIRLPGFLIVALSDEFLRPVAPCSPGFRFANAAKIDVLKTAAAMKWVCLGDLACRQRG